MFWTPVDLLWTVFFSQTQNPKRFRVACTSLRLPSPRNALRLGALTFTLMRDSVFWVLPVSFFSKYISGWAVAGMAGLSPSRFYPFSLFWLCASLPARHLLFSPLSCLTFLTSFGRKRSRDTIEELGRRVDYVRDLLCCAYISHHRTARHTQDTNACTHVQSDRRAGRDVFFFGATAYSTTNPPSDSIRRTKEETIPKLSVTSIGSTFRPRTLSQSTTSLNAHKLNYNTSILIYSRQGY